MPKCHDIELTRVLSHLPQRINFPAMSYTYGVFIFLTPQLSRGLHTPTYPQQVTHDSLPTTNQVTP